MNHPSLIQLEKRGLTSHRAQLRFDYDFRLPLDEILRKLDSIGASALGDVPRQCCTETLHKTCTGCGVVKTFLNHCDVGWCPLCQPRASRRKKSAIEWWTHQVRQPKHVVLTSRNVITISKYRLRFYKSCLNRLRRSKFARGWRGGFYSMEITKENAGWHIHFHLLVDADWIDARELSKEWAKRVGQDFAIVMVKDARRKDYLAELTKYAVKPRQMAGWTPYEIADFVIAIEDVRTFGVFGSCFGKKAEFVRLTKMLLADLKACECGCTRFTYESFSLNPNLQSRPPDSDSAVHHQPKWNSDDDLPFLGQWLASVNHREAVAR